MKRLTDQAILKTLQKISIATLVYAMFYGCIIDGPSDGSIYEQPAVVSQQ